MHGEDLMGGSTVCSEYVVYIFWCNSYSLTWYKSGPGCVVKLLPDHVYVVKLCYREGVGKLRPGGSIISFYI